ncbi:hypothetical protein EV361DRAFT_803294 [Lentinula raphanica]|uniref:Uncharacterized protein n=1 Tax=Lentinula raphanica TaxID=153919 RepID=A0AA38P5W4_9AGAR|nr:hypothetical protein F5880DRAFT_1472367 [Lentinula raphanica]KAJ3836899.1 hypothetical protein F5878DRAFT_540471 [Lentinula raphanica]KAJ3969747.1 hypothetical protein EV361DRAFT_803294 [Lentinula raphanica]
MQRALRVITRRPKSFYSSTTIRWHSTEKPKSPHAQWYADVLPAMVPIFLLGSAVYLGLQLAQTRLSHEKYMIEARERVEVLEAQIDALQHSRGKATESIPSQKIASGNSKWRPW